MAKCKRCNSSVGIRSVRLADGVLCLDCFEALGFGKSDRKLYSHISFEEIKNGKGKYLENLLNHYDSIDSKTASVQLGLRISHYGEERELDASDDELEIFDVLKGMFNDPDGQLRLVRKSDNYLTAVVGEWDLARFKCSARAKWIFFPCLEKASEKHHIDDPDDVFDFAELARDSLAHIIKYSD